MTFLTALVFPITLWSQGFYVQGNQLRDANGNNFVMKGINIPTAWFVSDVNNNIANIKNSTNANTFRIVINTSTADNAWMTSVERCIENDVIPMVELHDVTGSNSPADLQNMANWWASKAWFLTRSDISRYILINIANEWGDWYMSSPNHSPSQTVWRDAYINAIQTIRNAGINTTLVVDAPGYGQDNQGSTLLNYASAVQAGDPSHNILFSIHMYCEWSMGGNSSVASTLPAIKNAGIPIMIGEFGYQHSESGGTCDINESQIINTAQSNGIGWLAWSWKGNGGGVSYLDLSNDWAGTNLTGWGNTVVWGSNGTQTAQTASVFGGASSGCGTASNGYPICCDSGSDPDGDGWGWENNQSCYVEQSSGCGTYVNGYPVCCDSGSDPDGDGWGWENNQSCIVQSGGSLASQDKLSSNFISIDKSNESNSLVYPNPSVNQFTISSPGKFSFVLSDNLGRIVETGNGIDEAIIQDKFSSGIYFLRIKSADGTKEVKLIKN